MFVVVDLFVEELEEDFGADEGVEGVDDAKFHLPIVNFCGGGYVGIVAILAGVCKGEYEGILVDGLGVGGEAIVLGFVLLDFFEDELEVGGGAPFAKFGKDGAEVGIKADACCDAAVFVPHLDGVDGACAEAVDLFDGFCGEAGDAHFSGKTIA
ncbi:MAG: hypothetical protein S4CHLAM102_00190 [Chlamydiia bacterium]|nr:hypothetical protein [Chlamydiia bacterium]